MTDNLQNSLEKILDWEVKCEQYDSFSLYDNQETSSKFTLKNRITLQGHHFYNWNYPRG